MKTKTKPKKPFAKFPLTANGNGQWSKKILGKVQYFGVWSNWQGALEKYKKDGQYLHVGQTPPSDMDTVADLLNLFIEEKKVRLDEGRIVKENYREYETVSDTLADTLGTRTPLESLKPNDFTRLRTALNKKKNGSPYKISTFQKKLTIARMILSTANEYDISLKYAKKLEAPSRVQHRAEERERGEQKYPAADIRKLVENADPELRAMILMGINCGFGPKDCYTLPTNQLDLVGGWHTYWRTKTQIDRRCPLWPETVEALKVVISCELVFPGLNRHKINRRFKKLTTQCEVTNYGFYKLKHTLETTATSAPVNQAIINHALGWASHDMASVYRQGVYDETLLTFTNYARDWYLGLITLV